MKKFLLSSLILLSSFSCLFANTHQMQASRIESAPKIDGDASDEVWQKVALMYSGTFTQIEPDNLKKSSFITEIKVAYNDYSIFVLARMHDPEPKKILKELGLRDEVYKNTDFFGFILDTYKNGQNAFYFGVTAAGVQYDAYVTPQGEDGAWDAVWKSEVTISEEGWVAEFEIPYSAIRFSEKPEQVWGVNFIRRVQRENELSSWNPVDNKIDGFVNQAGQLSGLHNINPPVRLQFFPYVSAVAAHNGETGESDFTFGGGMDIKYGINESFTLDMSLIPDFSQVQSDNLILNLSPFEVQYNENRPFFTEGTELFNKGGLFYSRRVGKVFNSLRPYHYINEDDEEVIKSPADAQLLNATKISGRNKGGVGLGFFNAVTNEVYLTVQNKETLETREVQADPVTNFNVMVVDKTLKNNSTIGLINTNVTRFDGGPDANVLGSEFRFNNKDNKYRVEGFAAYSNRGRRDVDTGKNLYENGYKYNIGAGKVGGNFQFWLSRNVESDEYNVNDLGFIRSSNEVSHYAYAGYHIFNPFWKINRFSYNVNVNHGRLYKPGEFTSFGFNNNFYVQFKNFWSVGAGFFVNPMNSYDYFEPRVEEYYFTRKASHNFWSWLETDSRKRLTFNLNYGFFSRPAWNSYDWWLWVGPRYRISDKVSVSYNVGYTDVENERGFATILNEDTEDQEIIFGNRNIKVVEESANLNITFNNRMGLSLRIRHYWNKVRYTEFFELQRKGVLLASAYEGLDDEGEYEHNNNFNTFNVDLVYRWQIAPGSFLTFAWKDAIFDSHNNVDLDFFENYKQLMRVPQSNTLSLKLTYFVDYLRLKKAVE